MLRIEPFQDFGSALSLTADEAMPEGILTILEEEEHRAGGDSDRALEMLRERMIDDATLTVERARLVRWLVAQEEISTRLTFERN